MKRWSLSTSRHVIVRLAIAAVAVSGLSVPSAAADPAGFDPGPKPVAPATGLLLGDAADGRTPENTVAAVQDRLGRQLPIGRAYSRWDDIQPSNDVTRNLAQNRLPLLSITPLLRNGVVVPWASIARGEHDLEIRRQAEALKQTGRPILLAFHHEANLATGYGTPADFVAAFRQYVSVVRATQATNIGFTVILTPAAYAQAATWYPGDAYVDWIGTDAYNFGACHPGRRAWQSLADAARPFYTWASTTGKPLVLAEWGAPEDPADPTRRAQWMSDAQATLAAWPAIKAAIYFDQTGSCDWHIGTNGPTLDAFTTLARSALANGSITARLVTGVSRGPAPLSLTLDPSASTGAAAPSGQGVASWAVAFGDGTSTSGTGQPGPLTHTYAAGTWTTTLTVTDAAGGTATASVGVLAAALPKVSQGAVRRTGPGAATLPAWIQTDSLPGSFYVQWGDSTAFGNRTPDVALAAKSYAQSVVPSVSGLLPGVRYYWQVVATTSAGTGRGPVTSFVD